MLTIRFKGMPQQDLSMGVLCIALTVSGLVAYGDNITLSPDLQAGRIGEPRKTIA